MLGVVVEVRRFRFFSCFIFSVGCFIFVFLEEGLDFGGVESFGRD